MFENSRVCRTCSLTENELLPINAIIDNDTRVVDCFNECMKIDINEDDNLPQMICLTCLDHILEVRKFYLQIINAENYFKQILESNITKIQERNEIFDATFDPEIETIEEENISYSPNVVKEDCSEILVLSSQCDYENKDIDDDDDGYDEANTTKYEKIHQIDVERQELRFRRFSCNNCNETFKYEKNFKLHLRINHGIVEDESKESQTIEQDITTAEYQNDNYESRNKSETVKKSKTKYRCPICSYIFNFKNNFNVHLQRHHEENDYENIDNDRNLLEINYEIYDNDDSNNVQLKFNEKIESTLTSTSSSRRNKCSQCDRKFSTKQAVKRHFQAMHVIICILCNVKLSSQKDLDVHIKNDHEEEYLIMNKNKTVKKKYPCPYCDKEFLTKENYISHERTHTGERPYKCEYCDKTFIQRSTLSTHMILHTGEKKIKCSICDKKFIREGFLKVHMRSHTNERPYSCKYCKQTYAQKCHLKSHINSIHLNDKPFKCDFCDMKFNRKDILQTHLFTHIGKPFKCPVCSMESALLYRFRKHLVKVHGIHDDPRNFKRDPTYDPNMIVEEISDIMNGEDIEILEIDDPNFMTEINC